MTPKCDKIGCDELAATVRESTDDDGTPKLYALCAACDAELQLMLDANRGRAAARDNEIASRRID